MEELEKFIHDNRSAFDSELPPDSVWEGIDKIVNPELEAVSGSHSTGKRIQLSFVLRRIAAAMLLLIIGVGIGFYLDGHPQNPELLTLTDLSPEYAELESYYQSQVQMRMQQLVNYRQIADVEPDMDQLDAVYKELQLELENAPKGSEEQIIQAMIDNYKAKLSILERVLDRVQYTNPELSNPERDEISI